MPYFVQTAPGVVAYIEAIAELSDQGRAALAQGYIDELGSNADRFMTLYPLGHESLHFRYDYPQVDQGLLYEFEFVVDGTNMEMGVVSVVYVEHTVQPLS